MRMGLECVKKPKVVSDYEVQPELLENSPWTRGLPSFAAVISIGLSSAITKTGTSLRQICLYSVLLESPLKMKLSWSATRSARPAGMLESGNLTASTLYALF